MPVVINTSTNLPVTTKYAALVDEMFVQDSVYIRTKDTLQELLSSGDLSGAEKANVIAKVMSELNTSLVNASMSAALQWAKEEAELGLKKEEASYQLDLISQQAAIAAANILKTQAEVLLVEKEVSKTVAETAKINADKLVSDATVLVTKAQVNKVNAETKQLAIRGVAEATQTGALYGIAAMDTNGNITSIDRTGSKTAAEIELMEQELLNKQAEALVLGSKLKESQAAVYKIAADAAANYGSGFTVTATGDSISVTGEVAEGTLSYYQKEIAKQQAKGYVYSAWSNAVNASATAIATLNTEDDTSGLAGELQSALKAGVDQLINASSTKAAEPTPTT